MHHHSHHSGCPAFATSVIDVKDENGCGTPAVKVTSTESDPYLRDAPAVKVILAKERGDIRHADSVHSGNTDLVF